MTKIKIHRMASALEQPFMYARSRKDSLVYKNLNVLYTLLVIMLPQSCPVFIFYIYFSVCYIFVRNYSRGNCIHFRLNVSLNIYIIARIFLVLFCSHIFIMIIVARLLTISYFSHQEMHNIFIFV